jgi:hypothetical protein
MPEIFPSGARLGELTGTIKIIRENNGKISISKLAKKAHANIEHILPVIDAGVVLGVIETTAGTVKLTTYGKQFDYLNTKKLITDKIVNIEPFKSTVQILKTHKSVSTERLSQMLLDKGIALYRERDVNVALLRELLFKWGLLCGFLEHNRRIDSWSLREQQKKTMLQVSQSQ